MTAQENCASTNETVYEPSRKTPVKAHADVVVAGGGVAGVAAALAARRAGASVVLLEKECGLGGLATLGNVIIFLPLCDGRGRQVIGGLGEELLRLSVARVRNPLPPLRISSIPDCWTRDATPSERARHRFRVGFNPTDFQLDMESLLIKENISIVYDARCCGVTGKDGSLTSLLVEGKEGRFAVKGKAFVDATGDADLCVWAGEPTASADTNVACGWHYTYNAENESVKLHCMSKSFDADGGPPPEGTPAYAADSTASVTELVIESHRLIREAIDGLRKESGHELIPFHIPSIPSFRMTRRLRGSVELTEADAHHYFEDCVGLTGDWRKAGPVYSIPLSMLQGVRHPNLLVAGRCVSAVGRAWDVVRAIPTCVVTGQAAGTAAAVQAAANRTAGQTAAIDIKSVQRELTRAKTILEPSLVRNPEHPTDCPKTPPRKT